MKNAKEYFDFVIKIISQVISFIFFYILIPMSVLWYILSESNYSTYGSHLNFSFFDRPATVGDVLLIVGICAIILYKAIDKQLSVIHRILFKRYVSDDY